MICEDTEGHKPKFATDPTAVFVKHLYLCPPRLTSAQAVTALKRYFGFLLTGDSLDWQIQSAALKYPGAGGAEQCHCRAQRDTGMWGTPAASKGIAGDGGA